MEERLKSVKMKLVFSITHEIGRYCRIAVSTPVSYMACLINGCEVGKGNVFDGFIRVVNKSGFGKIRIGKGCKFNSSKWSNLIGINHGCIISALTKESKITIGNGCGFSGTVLAAFDEIVIEDGVRCGANTVITDSDWHLDDPRVTQPKKVRIRKGVWLGYGTVVLKGVEIGENTVIGAGSVVTKNIPGNVIASGNPCIVKRQIGIRKE